MSFMIHWLHDVNTYINKYQDTRTSDWFLMSSPFYTLAICLAYVYLVKYAGPKYMENRKPFQLRYLLIVYNLFQVAFSAWIFYEVGSNGWFGEYSWRCQPVDYSDKPKTVRMVHASWWYYMSKFTEFFDTFFFVLRKKFDHVSTLHVIHHGIMPMSVWFGVKFTPGGHSTFFGFLNSFVHIIMYFYYFLSALGPSMQRYLWWKKYLTTLQMVQFVGIMLHAFQLLFIDCNYPRAFVWWIGMHAVMFFFLFKEFYNKAYSSPNRKMAALAATMSICSPQSNGYMKHDNNHSLSNGTVGANGEAGATTKLHNSSNGHLVSETRMNGHSASKYYANGTMDIHQRTKATNK